MKRLTIGLSALMLVAFGGLWVRPQVADAAAMKATLQVAAAYKHNMNFAHTMASATIRKVKKGDVSLHVTAEHLPMPSVIKAKDYVVWLTDGSMKVRAGALTFHGTMAGLMATVMTSKVQDVVVTAEHSAMPAHPMGPTVLSGMVR